MPSSAIEVRRSYSASEVPALLAAVHDSLVAAFRIPEGDRAVRYIEHAPEHATYPPRLSDPERYTLVTIDCFSGRSADAKRHLYREIVERLEPLGIPRDHVKILLRESDPVNWGIRGGQAATDIDLGFTIEV
jgi:phenylpyruvate tautomerase PptA (4-oxalocrotonate tautomerase family)